jgi:integrase
VQRQA